MIKHEGVNISFIKYCSYALEMLSSDMENLKHLQARYGMTKPQAINLINKLINEQEKKDKLLDLYRLYNEFLERYYTQDRLLDKQHDLDILRELREEIYALEEKLK